MIVVDASVALKWVFDEEFADEARRIADGPNVALAPDFWLLEVGSALWRRHRRGELNADEAHARYRELKDFPIGFVTVEALSAAALDLALRLGHPIYDCCYLALALQQDVQVATADVRFSRAMSAGGYGARLHFVGDPKALDHP